MSAALYTASWRALWEGWKVGTLDVTPCSISVVTYPKFWPESQAYPRLELLAPRGIFGVVKDPAEYAARYLDRLERAGVDFARKTRIWRSAARATAATRRAVTERRSPAL